MVDLLLVCDRYACYGTYLCRHAPYSAHLLNEWRFKVHWSSYNYYKYCSTVVEEASTVRSVVAGPQYVWNLPASLVRTCWYKLYEAKFVTV
jgi:hypothetical protein